MAGVEREEWLRDRLLALESGAGVSGGLVAPLLAMGARVRGDMEEELGELDPHDEELLEWMEPAPGWPEAHRALFWRLVAAAFAGRYSDALLNLQADALERASAWHLAHEPDVAMVFLARRARLLSYASWGEDKVLASLDAALAVHRPGQNPPAAEYELIVQALEALDRVRSWRDEDLPRGAQVVALGLRGLELADELGGAPQRARLYHAVADGLTRGTAARLDDPTRARLEDRFGPIDTVVIAETAWRRAIELEDGDFYGEVTDDRRRERVNQYAWGLALLDLRRGELARALAVLEAPVGDSGYQRRQHTIRLFRLLRASGVPRSARLDALVRALRRDVVGGRLDTDFDLEIAVGYVDYGLYQLANLGAGPEHLAVVPELLARPGIAAAIERVRRDRAARDAKVAADAARLTDAIFSRLDRVSPRARAKELARLLASETAAERAARLAHDVASDVLEAAGAQLLIDVLIHPSPSGDELAIHAYLNCPEHALDTVRADPAIAAVLAALARRSGDAVPGAVIELRVASRSLAFGPGDDPFTGPALAAVGATEALAALALQAAPPPDLAEAKRHHSRRRGEIFLFA